MHRQIPDRRQVDDHAASVIGCALQSSVGRGHETVDDALLEGPAGNQGRDRGERARGG
ncbi:hypothetical protein [Amycolatopsis plumensis]|uniref:hypothetical protein n=1 Tax=Amycolatopsis plumensis TaxID=236508 RepID=UPI0036113BCA